MKEYVSSSNFQPQFFIMRWFICCLCAKYLRYRWISVLFCFCFARRKHWPIKVFFRHFENVSLSLVSFTKSRDSRFINTFQFTITVNFTYILLECYDWGVNVQLDDITKSLNEFFISLEHFQRLLPFLKKAGLKSHPIRAWKVGSAEYNSLPKSWNNLLTSINRCFLSMSTCMWILIPAFTCIILPNYDQNISIRTSYGDVSLFC